MGTDERKKIIPELQWMRGLMTLVVVLAHVNLIVDSSWLHGIFIQGWCGVDWFFPLSGFLLVWTYQSGSEVKKYVKKRFFRIYPAYWIYTIVTLVFTALCRMVLHKQFISWIETDFWGLLRCFALIPTNTAINEMPILPTAWTLPYEIIFYLFFLIYIVKGKKKFEIAVAIWSGLIVMSEAFIQPSNYLLAFILSPIFFEFFMGAMVAILLKNRMISNELPTASDRRGGTQLHCFA